MGGTGGTYMYMCEYGGGRVYLVLHTGMGVSIHLYMGLFLQQACTSYYMCVACVHICLQYMCIF